MQHVPAAQQTGPCICERQGNQPTNRRSNAPALLQQAALYSHVPSKKAMVAYMQLEVNRSAPATTHSVRPCRSRGGRWGLRG